MTTCLTCPWQGAETRRRQKAEGRRQKAEGRRQKAEGRGQRAEGRGQRAEDRGQRAEGRGQRAEGRGQKAEGRRQKAEGRRQKAEGRRQKAEDFHLLTGGNVLPRHLKGNTGGCVITMPPGVTCLCARGCDKHETPANPCYSLTCQI